MTTMKPIFFAGLIACASAQAQIVAQKDRFGDTMRFALPLAAAAISFAKDDTDGIKELAMSMALSQGSTELIKRVADSKRPDGTGRGFPSGHVSAVFTAATYIHERYSLQWALPMYALATATAYERVHTRHHFAKDVVAGAAVGSLSALAFTGSFTAPRSGVAVGYADHTLAVTYARIW